MSGSLLLGSGSDARYELSDSAKVDVKTVAMFRAIIHSTQSRECEDRKRELDAKREAERKAKKRNRRIVV